MELPDRHTFRLELPGLPELADLARTFLQRVIRFADFEGKDAEELCDAACATLTLVEKAVEARDDVDLPIELRAVVDATELEITILEHGIPLDERSDGLRDIKDLEHAFYVFDDVSWEQKGQKGSELHLQRHRRHPEITTIEAVEQRLLEKHPEDAGEGSNVASDAGYTIRKIHPEDALEVSRRIYESYGRSYPNSDLYYPARIAALNKSGQLLSVVAEAPDGSIVGHCALERPRLRPIAEVGVVVVDPDHRGRGLFGAMRKLVFEEAGSLKLLGTWTQPTTRHAYTQRQEMSSGSTACGLSLGTTPASTALRVDSDDSEGLRYSCFIYWQPIGEEAPVKVSVPESTASLVEAIYKERGRSVTIDTACDTDLPQNEHAEQSVRTRFDRTRKSGWIELTQVDSNSIAPVCEAMTLLIDIAGAEVIYIDIPITDPGCAALASKLMEEDVLFAGIGPYFIGDDVLRLQRLIAPVDLDGLVIEGELGGRIAEFVLASVRT